MAKLDLDTQKELSDGEELRNMLGSRGWAFAKARLDEKILDLQNISNVDVSSPDAAVIDLKARKMAADYLFSWVRNDLYGYVEQQENARQQMRDKQIDDFIGRDK